MCRNIKKSDRILVFFLIVWPNENVIDSKIKKVNPMKWRNKKQNPNWKSRNGNCEQWTHSFVFDTFSSIYFAFYFCFCLLWNVARVTFTNRWYKYSRFTDFKVYKRNLSAFTVHTNQYTSIDITTVNVFIFWYRCPAFSFSIFCSFLFRYHREINTK